MSMSYTKRDKILYLIILFTVCILLYILRIRKKTEETLTVQRAARDSEFKQCEFIIYDKSSKSQCDRLIIIEPFNWILWNTRNNLFVLNSERDIQCTGQNIGAVQMLYDEFYETCLDVSNDYIVKNYMSLDSIDVTTARVPYVIYDRVFKITDAVNELLKLDLLQYDVRQTVYDSNIVSNTDGVSLSRIGNYVPYKRNVYDYNLTHRENERESIIKHNIQTGYAQTLNDNKALLSDRTDEDAFLDKILQNVYVERETDVQKRRNGTIVDGVGPKYRNATSERT